MKYTFDIRIDAQAVDRLIALRGFKSRAGLARACGWNPRGGFIDRFLTPNPAKRYNPLFNSLGTMCAALDCHPGDIIYYERIPVFEESEVEATS